LDAAFLVAFLALPVLAYVRSRNLGWLAIYLGASISVAGVLVGLARDLGHSWTMVELQWVTLASLLVVTALAWLRPVPGSVPMRRQVLGVLAPMALVGLVVFVVTTFMTQKPAFMTPVSYLIGHAVAEDNAKWLDFSSQLASGAPIVQTVPLGGPLQLLLVIVATAMSVVSMVVLGGVNQVAVAANTVVFGEFFMVMLVPLALAPLLDFRLRTEQAAKRVVRTLIPLPFIWLAAIVIGSVTLLVTEYGHLTLPFTFLIMALWSVTFLVNAKVPRARLLTSLIVAAAMTVWLPLNVLAVMILVGWLVILIGRAVRGGFARLDTVGLALTLIVTISVWQPIRSSLLYLIGAPVASGPVDDGVSAGVRGVSAAVSVLAAGPSAVVRLLGLDEGSLFASTGGTEQTEPILGILAVGSLLVAVIVLARQPARSSLATYARFAPIGLLAFFSIAITFLDLWTTGSGPHYGSVKFTFMTAVVVLGTTIPFSLMQLDRGSKGMSPLRWAGVGAVLLLLVMDTVLPRSVAALRPQQWSPPIPFDNPASYWWPADVKESADQPVATNPVACVYLPPGAKVPSALVPSGLSDAQRVYSCTRIISGLAGADATAQPLVDWLRREWLTNTPAWAEVYTQLQAMPESVQDKPVILLDEGSNVVGLETVRTLLARYPQYAGKTPEEMAVINAEKAAQ
jgi:hypothetical protein